MSNEYDPNERTDNQNPYSPQNNPYPNNQQGSTDGGIGNYGGGIPPMKPPKKNNTKIIVASVIIIAVVAIGALLVSGVFGNLGANKGNGGISLKDAISNTNEQLAEVSNNLMFIQNDNNSSNDEPFESFFDITLNKISLNSEEMPFLSGANFNLYTYADLKNKKIALYTGAGFDSNMISIDAFLDNYNLAVKVPELYSKYLSFNIATLNEDWANGIFGAYSELPYMDYKTVVDELFNIDNYNTSEKDSLPAKLSEQYNASLSQYVDKSKEVKTADDGEYKKFTVIIPGEEVKSAINSLVDIVLEDDNYTSYMTSLGLTNPDSASIMTQAMNMLKQNSWGSATLDYYVGKEGFVNIFEIALILDESRSDKLAFRVELLGENNIADDVNFILKVNDDDYKENGILLNMKGDHANRERFENESKMQIFSSGDEVASLNMKLLYENNGKIDFLLNAISDGTKVMEVGAKGSYVYDNKVVSDLKLDDLFLTLDTPSGSFYLSTEVNITVQKPQTEFKYPTGTVNFLSMSQQDIMKLAQEVQVSLHNLQSELETISDSFNSYLY